MRDMRRRPVTPKERIVTAFRNRKPDRVPVSPELWDAIPIRVSGKPFYEMSATSFGSIPLWKAQLDAYRFFGCEAWIPVEPGPSQRQQSMLQAVSRFVHKGLIRTDVAYRGERRTLHEVKHSSYDYDLWSTDPPVRDLFRDLPVIEEYFFEDPTALDYSEISRAWTETADSGICEGIVGNSFFEFLTLFRSGGAVQVILDLHDYPDRFEDLRDRYAVFLAGIAEEICRRDKAEGLFLNCGSSTLTVISPPFFRKWDIPVIKAVSDVVHRYDKIFHYHLHGKGRALLDDLADAGVTMLCPLEDPPKGDFLLQEVKANFGERMALKGGIDPFLLRDGKPEAIEERVRRCIDEAGTGGGYTLGTGDGVLRETDFDRIRSLVRVARQYGTY
jgi:uroporphyrinogen decarboxylase